MRAIGLSILAATLSIAHADTKPAKHDPKTFLDHAALLDPIRAGSLALVPIVADAASTTDDLLVLDEAMREKLVRITEFDEGNVNSLHLQNRADRPVFLLAGEVIIGGKQDRIIGRNTIIPPKTTLEVPVYCVEHGRWDSGPKEFTSANALAHGRLRAQASYASQQDVWNEVATKNKARKTTSRTDTYRKVAVQQADGTNASWEKQVDDAIAKLAQKDRERMIGFAVSLDGKIATIDVFGSPKLFRKLEKKLVRSYITEAVDVKTDPKAKPPTMADVKAFVADAEKQKAQRAYETKAAATYQFSSDAIGKSAVFYSRTGSDDAKPAKERAKPAEELLGDDGEALYLNYQSK